MAFQDLDSAELALVEGGAIPPTWSTVATGVAVGFAAGVATTLVGRVILDAIGAILIVGA
jgi:hypothetical protein